MEYCQKVYSYLPLLDNVDLVAVKVCFFFDNAESARFCQMQGFLPLHKNKLLPVERHGVLWVKGRFEKKDKKGLGECKRGQPFFLPGPPTAHFFYSLHTHRHTPHSMTTPSWLPLAAIVAAVLVVLARTSSNTRPYTSN